MSSQRSFTESYPPRQRPGRSSLSSNTHWSSSPSQREGGESDSDSIPTESQMRRDMSQMRRDMSQMQREESQMRHKESQIRRDIDAVQEFISRTNQVEGSDSTSANSAERPTKRR